MLVSFKQDLKYYIPTSDRKAKNQTTFNSLFFKQHLLFLACICIFHLDDCWIFYVLLLSFFLLLANTVSKYKSFCKALIGFPALSRED